MDVDIQIYVKKIQDFFNNDKEARKEMFGNVKIDMTQFYSLVVQQATLNYKEIGDPTLSPPQLMAIMADLTVKEAVEELGLHKMLHLYNDNTHKLFSKPLKGFPPYCLN